MPKLTTAFLKDKITKDWMYIPFFSEIRYNLENQKELYLPKCWKRVSKQLISFEKSTDDYLSLDSDGNKIYCEWYTCSTDTDEFEITFNGGHNFSYWFVNLTPNNITQELTLRTFQFSEYEDCQIHVFSNKEDDEILCVSTHID